MTKPDYQKVKKEVSKILFNFDINEPPIPLGKICDSYHLNIYYEDLASVDESIAGFLKYDSDNKSGDFFINRSDPKNRQKFTIAHELGHFVLHKQEITKNPDKYAIVPSRPGEWQKDPIEKEANFFAGCLLVPEFMLKEYISIYGEDVEILSRVFGVSESLINYRLINGY